MKKALHLLLFLCLFGTIASAQEVLLSEDFENGWPEGFELINVDMLIPNDPDLAGLADSAWTIRYITQEGWNSNAAFSVSWYENDEGPSDDWMILPAIDLGENTVLSWTAMAITSSGDFRDRYQVAISTGDPVIEDFEENALLFDTGNLGEIDLIQMRSVNLADAGYSNQTVYIAFRNFTAPFDPDLPQGPGNGGNELMIDDIVIEDGVSAVENLATEEMALNVAPNPATNQMLVNYRLQESSSVQLEIYTLTGQHLRTQEIQPQNQGTHSQWVNIENLSPGMYLLSVRTPNQIGTIKFSVQ
jgi:hypothetical protein